jgi:hypothetical protein
VRESTLERYFVQRVLAAGGETRKMVWPGRRHAPDRIVFWPKGISDLVELKAPGEKPRPGQVREHARLKKLGHGVHVFSTKREVDIYVSISRALLCS